VWESFLRTFPDALEAEQADFRRERAGPVRVVEQEVEGRVRDRGVLDHPDVAHEWIDGESLASRLRRGPLTLDEGVSLIARVADALASAHSRQIIRVKPSNLLLPRGDLEQAKIIDFGLASARHLRLDGVITPKSDLLGTPAYMAPEMIRGIHEIDARADVYALGCALFECLAGRRAFPGEHVFATLAKILVGEAPRLADTVADVPPRIDDLLSRMLAKNPDDRPRDASVVRRELERSLAGPSTPGDAPADARAGRRGTARLLDDPDHGAVDRER